eukprot:4293853-Pyramimonas_sp.AAC.1
MGGAADRPCPDQRLLKDYKSRIYKKMDALGQLALVAKDAGKGIDSLVAEISCMKLMAQSTDKASVQLGKLKSMRDTACDKLKTVHEQRHRLAAEEQVIQHELEMINNSIQE